MNNNISMGFSCGDEFEGEESEEVPLIIDETREKQQQQSYGGGGNGMDVHVHGSVELLDLEFWPVEHPSEPPDEDRPVKCPMPDSSVINDGGGRHQEKRLSAEQSMRKRSTQVSAAEAINNGGGGMDEMVVAGTEPPPVRAVRKRHHTLTRGDHIISPLRRMPPHPSLPTHSHSITVFQMLQQFDKFES